MTLSEFWNIVAMSRSDFDPNRRNGNMELQEQRLEQLLSKMPSDDVQEFGRIFGQLYNDAYRWDLWGAAFIINGGDCSDDSFMDFRNWLISMGREVYDRALADPQSLADVARAPGVEDCGFLGFGEVAPRILEERGDEPAEFEHAAEPAGEPWQEEDLPSLFPKLWAKFGEPDT